MATIGVMRAARSLILLITLLTLPVYGLAGVTQRSCQDQMSAAGHTAQVGDCCPGKMDRGTPCKGLGDGSGPAGKDSCTPCKAGYTCKSPQSFEPSTTVVLFVLPSQAATPAEPSSPLISHSPN